SEKVECTWWSPRSSGSALSTPGTSLTVLVRGVLGLQNLGRIQHHVVEEPHRGDLPEVETLRQFSAREQVDHERGDVDARGDRQRQGAREARVDLEERGPPRPVAPQLHVGDPYEAYRPSDSGRRRLELVVAHGAAGDRDPRVHPGARAGDGRDDPTVTVGDDVDGVLLAGKQILHDEVLVDGERLERRTV